MGKNTHQHPIRIPCGLCATAKCQGDADRRWIYGQTVAKDDSRSLGLGASSGRRRRERGGLARGIISWRKRGSGGLDLGAPRSLGVLLGRCRRPLRRLDHSSRAASSSAARRSLVAWAAAASIIMPKNGCQALLLRSCGRGGRAAGGPVGDALGVLLLDQLPERVALSSTRVATRAALSCMDCDICRCAQSAGNRSRCAIPRPTAISRRG